VTAATAICGLVLFRALDTAGSGALARAALMFLAMSLLPTLTSGVMPLRLVEPAFLMYAGGSLVGIPFLARLILVLVGWVRAKYPVPI
jgi:hypothetical protein